jgi:hypothetical protein
MRIITRGDFDGLVCTVLLTEVEKIGEIRMVHPKDAQDGKVAADAEDIVVNLPYIKGCGLWFDHHSSEEEKATMIQGMKGRFEVAPSCARVIYNHYKASQAGFDRFAAMLEACDKLDSANLTTDDVTEPEGWILLGLTLDPRTGLGPEFQKYFRWLAEYLKEVPIEKVLKHPEVQKRTERVMEEQEDFEMLLAKHARCEENVIITDFRGVKDKPVGNRFLVYTQFLEANVEMRIFDGHKGAVVVALGHSIFNRSSKVNVGKLCAEYGGGGHKGAGTAQLAADKAEAQIKEILVRLKHNR